tara:strand:- start:4623 stop:5261 length:639 start_codon:yes stop_codon:yes gene_type:complete
MPNKIIVIDYGMGNTKSVCRAIEKMGGKALISNNNKTISQSKKLILPGVGSFASGMSEIKKKQLDKSIKLALSNGAYLFGICLGMQLLFNNSEENGITEGLNLVEGEVKKIPIYNDNQLTRKIPHIGWNKIFSESSSWNDTFLKNIKSESFFYFIHSFMAMAKNRSDVIAYCNYLGINIPSVICRNKVFGTQFHPENSGPEGLKIYKNFILK